MNKDYVAGFIEGEGCFFVRHKGRTYQPHFTIQLRDDDKVLLEKIRDAIGIDQKLAHNKAHKGTKPCVKLNITSIANNLKLIEYLGDNPFHGSKKLQYEVWKEAVHFHARINKRLGSHMRRSDEVWKKLELYCNKLSEMKKYSEVK